MNTTENEYAELNRMLAALGAGITRLSDRLDRIEASQVKTAAIIRDIHGDAKLPRRRFRPLDLSNRIQG